MSFTVQHDRSRINRVGGHCVRTSAGFGAWIAQRVERPTEKPDAVAIDIYLHGSMATAYTYAGSSPRCGKGFYFPESTSSADSLKVFVQPLCSIACFKICARVKNCVQNTIFPHKVK